MVTGRAALRRAVAKFQTVLIGLRRASAKKPPVPSARVADPFVGIREVVVSTARRRSGTSRRGSHGFDFCRHMRSLCVDMTSRLSPLEHIDMSRVAISFCQTRRRSPYGMYASLTPLRFANGKTEITRGGRRWRLQRLLSESGEEMLYVMSFYLPRFLNLSLSEKLNTVAHELWHISPEFNGDVRRFGGRCFAHGGSQKKYDMHVAKLVADWRRLAPPESLFGFLRLGFDELIREHGGVYGVKIRNPKLIPVE